MREQQPEAFDPYRWLRPEAKAFTDSYIPFSLGSRACVGKGFAMMEMSKALAALFRLFKFERKISKGIRGEGRIHAEDYRVRSKDIVERRVAAVTEVWS